MKLVTPVLGVEERDAAVIVLRAVIQGRLVVEHDAWKLRHAIEALTMAPERESGSPAKPEMGPFARRSETSRRAAISTYPRAGSQRARVLDRLLAVDRGLSREQLAAKLGMGENSVRPRVRELIEGGFVEVLVGETRRTAQGLKAEVLVASSLARAQARKGLVSAAR